MEAEKRIKNFYILEGTTVAGEPITKAGSAYDPKKRSGWYGGHNQEVDTKSLKVVFKIRSGNALEIERYVLAGLRKKYEQLGDLLKEGKTETFKGHVLDEAVRLAKRIQQKCWRRQ